MAKLSPILDLLYKPLYYQELSQSDLKDLHDHEEQLWLEFECLKGYLRQNSYDGCASIDS